MTPVLLSLLLVAAGSSAAQQNSVPPDMVAWTAYWAAEAGDRSQAPALQALLPHLIDRDDVESRYALGAVLDALWRLGARPGLDLLPGISRTHPIEAIMFLTRFGPERDEVALPLLRRAHGYEWLALANLMIDTRPAGYGAILVKDLRLLLLIAVSEDDQVGLVPGVGGGVGCGVFAGRAPGFPPLAAYKLVSDRDKNAPVLIAGPRSIRYQRVPGRAGNPPYAGRESEQVTADDRLAYIRALLGTDSLPVAGVERHAIAWRGRADLIARLDSFTRDLEERYAELLDRLTSAAILSPAERHGLCPRIDVGVGDLRRDRSDSLPTLP